MAGLLAMLAGLWGCDAQRIKELEEGVATEADVRQRFGEPEQVWDGANGDRIFEFNRQPAGHRNYMITVSPGGVMTSLRQVLTPENFATVQPGMPMETLRRRLGKPMKVTPYALKNQTEWDWRFLDGPTNADSKIFTAVLDADQRVVATRISLDPALSPGS